jgi:hypothetical protein
MSRRRTSPLKPQLNQIRAWAQQGRTDAWIGHQLDVSPASIAEFRAEQGIVRAAPSAAELGQHEGEAPAPAPATRPEAHGPVSLDSVADLLDAELAARPPRREAPAPIETPADEAAEPTRRRRRTAKPAATDEAPAVETETPAEVPAAEADAGEGPDGTKRRRRRRTGTARTAGEAEPAAETPEVAAPTPEAPPAEPPAETPAPRRRRRTAAEREATVEAPSADTSRVEGRLTRTLALELDASLLDDPVFREHWLAVRDVVAEVRAGEIVLRPR